MESSDGVCPIDRTPIPPSHRTGSGCRPAMRRCTAQAGCAEPGQGEAMDQPPLPSSGKGAASRELQMLSSGWKIGEKSTWG